MIKLPQLLYRGDSDKENVRQIRATLNLGILMTGLSNGGNGREVFLNPLEKLIHRHVASGWNKTHFLSFTTDMDKAYHYGAGDHEFYTVSTDEQWDFALFTLATDKFYSKSIKQLETGVYQAEYYPDSCEFLPVYRIMLINVVTFLQNIQQGSNDFSESIFNAERDNEWLIYPAIPMRGSIEFTSKFDTGCLIRKEVYKIY